MFCRAVTTSSSASCSDGELVKGARARERAHSRTRARTYAISRARAPRASGCSRAYIRSYTCASGCSRGYIRKLNPRAMHARAMASHCYVTVDRAA